MHRSTLTSALKIFLVLILITILHACDSSMYRKKCSGYSGGGGGLIFTSKRSTSDGRGKYDMGTYTKDPSPTKKDYKNNDIDIKAGSLTAGELNDFGKWVMWSDISDGVLKTQKDLWKIYPKQRYTVQVSNEAGKPLADVPVNLMHKNNIVWQAKTDNTGKAELWANMITDKDSLKGDFTITVMNNGNAFPINKPKTFAEGINLVKFPDPCNYSSVLDIAFVVDATGSMGDEIQYLKVELKDVIERIKTQQTDLKINLGSVFYRDKGDSYLTRVSDFSTDINKTIDFIAKQDAGGGGDFPEAVDAALEDALKMKWSSDARARIMFLVLDAPPHETKEDIERVHNAMKKAAEKGIRIIPITASGITKDVEYLMRSLALATNGTYVFLTNHSGIGGDHIEPSTDTYEVELLNELLVRLCTQYTSVPGCDTPVNTVQKSDTLVIKGNVLVMNPGDTTNKVTSKVVLTIPVDTAETSKNTTKVKGIKCYPNPTSGNLTVDIDGELGELFLADISGKLLQKITVKDIHRIELDLTPYPNGVYFVQYINKEKWYSGKVILAR
jgi:hypothetical protein